MSTVQIDKLLQTVVNHKASDLHITTGQPPVVRAGGRMVKLETKSLEAEDTVALMKSITPERNQQELQEKGGTDFGFAFGEQARFRVAVFKQKGHVGMVLRRIPSQFLSFEVLGLPPVIVDLITRPRGLFLVTGPTGSGKTTSLASMINHINHTEDRHIITLEDPIEYYHQHKKSTICQREVGVDVQTFSEGLRRALRMDPDVILVGEMRDLETIQSAITAAETGHLVFGTLHTSGAEGTVNRIIDAFPTNQQEQVRVQLATAIIGVLSQALLPKKAGGGDGGVRDAGGDLGDREPDPREQDVPHSVEHPDRAQVRDAADGRRAVQPLEERDLRREGSGGPVGESGRIADEDHEGQAGDLRRRGRGGRRGRMSGAAGSTTGWWRDEG